jgi:response regulator RpfG family c-di-GMP phosphodiesterase
MKGNYQNEDVTGNETRTEQALRASELSDRRLPVIVLSSSRETPDLIECYKHGVNAYVVKPVDFAEFMQAVKQLGVFWAAVNEPPPHTGREEASIQSGEVISSGKKEV